MLTTLSGIKTSIVCHQHHGTIHMLLYQYCMIHVYRDTQQHSSSIHFPTCLLCCICCFLRSTITIIACTPYATRYNELSYCKTMMQQNTNINCNECNFPSDISIDFHVEYEHFTVNTIIMFYQNTCDMVTYSMGLHVKPEVYITQYVLFSQIQCSIFIHRQYRTQNHRIIKLRN